MLKSTPRVNSSDPQGASNHTLRTLFESEESALLRYAFALTGRRAVAEEIVQEVFLHLHASWADVETPRAWLYRSVRNRAFNHARDTKREMLNIDEHETPANSDAAASPESMLERMETLATLRKIIASLDESDQQLVRLKYFENLKYRDISERTGLSVSNVGYRLHHILKGLAGQLRPLGIDGKS